MPEIKAQHQCATLDNLILAESFGEPIGDLPLQKDSSFFEKDNIFSGTWECEPGILDLDLEVTEFCHILKGHWVLTSESGQITEVKAGASFVFPRGGKGTAEVKETIRKVSMIVSSFCYIRGGISEICLTQESN